ncbi:MAG: tRNA (adenosine(37)-N6)-dimethylallyltransferase MiaA [Acidobacteria bacterium]|nr:MAG: tRNA (adenosine(37)-N6)-dimethylallyltransferase MiaA [Acidobacteriota bacterium]
MGDCIDRPLVLAIVGPTATGKSALALELADRFNGEIVSVDSVQVYRGMDIGSDKPIKSDQIRVPHHMIDLLDSTEEIDVEEFRSKANIAIREIRSRRRLPLLVGGSALYFTALTAPVHFRPTDPGLRLELEAKLDAEGLPSLVSDLEQVDPRAAQAIDVKNPRRVVRALESRLLLRGEARAAGAPLSTEQLRLEETSSGTGTGPAALTESREREFPVTLVGLALASDRVEHTQRIRRRAESMFDRGFEDEVRSVFGLDGDTATGSTPEPSRTARQALGYKEVASAISEGQSGDSAIEAIVARTRQLSRRQTAWFRRDARLSWISVSRISQAGLLDAASSYFQSRLRAIGKEFLA